MGMLEDCGGLAWKRTRGFCGTEVVVVGSGNGSDKRKDDTDMACT